MANPTPAPIPVTFASLIKSRLPANHPVDPARVTTVLNAAANNESRLQLAYNIWARPILDSRDTEGNKDAIAILFGATHTLSCGRVRRIVNGNPEDVNYQDCRFQQQMLEWEKQARLRQGKSGKVSAAFGAKQPDGLVFAYTFVVAADWTIPIEASLPSAPLANPLRSTSWAAVAALSSLPSGVKPGMDSARVAKFTPPPRSETIPSSAAQMPSPPAQPLMKRHVEPQTDPPNELSRQSSNSSKNLKTNGPNVLEAKYGSPGERAYYLPALTAELKPSDVPLASVVCQGLAYLINCHETCGTYLGLLLRGHTYAIVYAISDDLFAIKGTDEQTVEVGESLTVEQYLATYHDLPHSLGTMALPNLNGFQDIQRVLSVATNLLIDLPLKQPLPFLNPPSGDIVGALRQLSIKGLDNERTRKFIAGDMRPSIEGLRLAEEAGGRDPDQSGRGGRGGVSGNSRGGRGTGGGSGKGSGRGGRGGQGGQGGRGQGSAGGGSGGASGKGKGRQHTAVRAVGSSGESSGNLTSSTSSGSSDQKPITPQDALIVPQDTASEIYDASKLTHTTHANPASIMSTAVVAASLPPTEEVGEEDPLEEATFSSGFRESDFPDPDADDYPAGSDEEELDSEEEEEKYERAMLFLAQRAVIRRRGVRMVELSPALFDCLMEEIAAGIQAL